MSVICAICLRISVSCGIYSRKITIYFEILGHLWCYILLSVPTSFISYILVPRLILLTYSSTFKRSLSVNVMFPELRLDIITSSKQMISWFFLMDHRFEDVHPCLPSAWENIDFNSFPPKWPRDIGNYHKLLSKGLNLPITSCFCANNWDFYKETAYCGMRTTIIHPRALAQKWSVFRNKKGISPDRYNTKPWNCTPKLGGLYWFFPRKKF